MEKDSLVAKAKEGIPDFSEEELRTFKSQVDKRLTQLKKAPSAEKESPKGESDS